MSVKLTHTWSGGERKKESFPPLQSLFLFFCFHQVHIAQSEPNPTSLASRSRKPPGWWTPSPRIDCRVSERMPQPDNNTWQKCRRHLFHAAFNSGGIMIKGNNQNGCEHNRGRDAMGYYSPTGSDWALTGGRQNKLCSSHDLLVHLPASRWNFHLRLAGATDKGAKRGNVRMRGGFWGRHISNALQFFF